MHIKPNKNELSELNSPQGVNFKGSEFVKRFYSALVLLSMAVFFIYMGGWLYNSIVIVCGLLMWLEWLVITNGRSSKAVTYIGAVCLVGVPVLMVLYGAAVAFGVLLLFSVVLLISGARAGVPLPWPGLGAVYIGLPLMALMWLRAIPDVGLSYVSWIIVVVCATDTFGYIVGRSVGGRRLVPRYSPKKTWSGLIGGMVAASLFSVVVGYFFGALLSMERLLIFVVLGSGAAVIAQTGDILESMVKRRFGVKDSGSIIPGHGGILDRVDGILTTSVLFALSVFVWSQV